MHSFQTANLLRVFDFYLAATLLVSFARRYPVYVDGARVVLAFRGRWPRLVGRLSQNHGVLVTGQVLYPTAVALLLMAVQTVSSRVIWPTAEITAAEIAAVWWMQVVAVVALVPMVAVDGYFLVRVGRFDRLETEQYFDEAEKWLGSWKTPVLRAVTLGYLDPARIVDAEVKKGMTELGATVAWVMRWVAIQAGCRIAFGLTLWLLWAAK